MLCAHGAPNAAHTWERLKTQFPEVCHEVTNFKFSGQGQRETPVADARGIVEIIMVLPGKAAASYRKQAANLVVRYLGGDLTMVDEIAANRLAQEQLPDEHPARIFGQTVEYEKSEAIKHKREELELAELDRKIKRVKLDSVAERVSLNLETMKQLGLPVDDRDCIKAKDLLNTALHEETNDKPEDQELCIKRFLLEAGVHLCKRANVQGEYMV